MASIQVDIHNQFWVNVTKRTSPYSGIQLHFSNLEGDQVRINFPDKEMLVDFLAHATMDNASQKPRSYTCWQCNRPINGEVYWWHGASYHPEVRDMKPCPKSKEEA